MTSYGRKAERPASAHALAQRWASAEPRSFPDNTSSSPKKLRRFEFPDHTPDEPLHEFLR
jgi:hypothetical protein